MFRWLESKMKLLQTTGPSPLQGSPGPPSEFGPKYLKSEHHYNNPSNRTYTHPFKRGLNWREKSIELESETTMNHHNQQQSYRRRHDETPVMDYIASPTTMLPHCNYSHLSHCAV